MMRFDSPITERTVPQSSSLRTMVATPFPEGEYCPYRAVARRAARRRDGRRARPAREASCVVRPTRRTVVNSTRATTARDANCSENKAFTAPVR
jgi:hypothetical protein